MKLKLLLIFLTIEAFQCNAQITSLQDSMYFWLWNDSAQNYDVKSRHHIYHDGNGDYSEMIRQNFQNGFWENIAWTVYTFDNDHHLLSYTSFNWSVNSWEQAWVNTFLYDSIFNIISVTTQACNGPCINDMLRLNTYDSNNDFTMELYQDWDGSAWVSTQQRLMTYDTNHNKILELIQRWDTVGWENFSLWNGTYDANDNLITDSTQYWYVNAWEGSTRNFRTEDMFNNDSIVISQRWDGTAWVNNAQSFITYDLNQNKVYFLGQDWVAGSWHNQYQMRHTYDINNNEVSRVLENWDSIGWKLYDSLHFYYSDHFTGTPDLNLLSESVSVYPNPASDAFTIGAGEEMRGASIEILNVMGKKVYAGRLTGTETKIDCAFIPAGIYFLRLDSGDKVVVKKVLIN